MATKVKWQRLNEGAAVENLWFNPDKRPIQGEWEPTGITPEYIGQQYVDTTNNKMYFATWTEEGNWEAVWAGGGWDFDPAGYYPRLHAGVTDQIYTDENTISIWDWNFRTTAGDVSVPSSWEAKLLSIKWAPLRREAGQTDTLAQFEITSTEGIEATIENKYLFIRSADNVTWEYTFTLSWWNWDQDPFSWWIHETHEWITDGTITVNFTAESRADLRAIRPRIIRATGVNQLGTPGWWTVVFATIQNWEIVAWDHYIMYVKAYGWVTNGYMAYNTWGDIITVWRCANQPDFGTTITQNNIWWDSTEMWMPFEQTWYFVVEASNQWSQSDWWNSIHPRWSNQQRTNTDGYGQSDAYFPTNSTDRSTLPYYINYWYGNVWLPAIWDVYDEMNMQTGKYTQRIGYAFPGAVYDLYNFILNLPEGTRFEYDNRWVYYVLESENVIDMMMEWYSLTYTANDYGTEWILDENGNLIEYPTWIETSYWTNLVDKLRTWVVLKTQLPQVMHQAAYNNLWDEKNSDWVIRFIYTADKPDTFIPLSGDLYGNYPMTIDLGFAVFTPEWYPFEISVTSDDPSVVQLVGTPYIESNNAYCSAYVPSTWSCTWTITIWWVTKTRSINFL